MIETNYVIDGVHAVYFNKKRLGAFVIQDDGYFGFYPDDLKGYWSSHALRLIADKLDELNAAWDEYINKNLK
jgi:S-formylglutathione hydrolase FrmB